MPNLFRPEVLEGRRQAWLGTIQLIRPVSLAVSTTLVVLTAVAIGTFLVEGRYTRKAHVSGYLVPDRGVLRLTAPQSGTVVESRAVEGQRVHRGDVLFVLSVDSSTLAGDTQAAVQASIGARTDSLQRAAGEQVALQQERQAALARQAVDMRREMTQMDAEADLQRERLSLAQAALDRMKSLQNQNFVSEAQVKARTEDVLGVRAQLQSLLRQRAEHERQIGVLDAQRRELPLQLAARRGEIERDVAALSQASAENAARQTLVVRAPQDGTVTAVLVQPGLNASSGTALASLLPTDATLQAQLFAPSSAVGFVRPDQTVQLRYQAFPFQKFGHAQGAVLQVSRTPLLGSELAGLPLPEALRSTPNAEPLYRITVRLDQQAMQAYGQAQPLVPGMQLDADVLLDRRRLIEWLFEPLFGVAGRV